MSARDVERLVTGVWRLPMRGVNAYLVDDGDLTLVDAGTPWDVGRIRRAVSSAGFDVKAVDRVLVTHYDLDHVGTLAALDLDAPIYMPEPDASYLEGTGRPPLFDKKGALQRFAGVFVRPPSGVDRVEDGDDVGGFRAYHTPGHVAYVHPERSVALLGDLVAGDGDALTEPPRFVVGDVERNRETIRGLPDRVPAFEVAAMGHGTPLAERGYAALVRLANRVWGLSGPPVQ